MTLWLEFLVAYHLMHKDIFSPSIIAIGVFIISTTLFLINAEKWNAEISLKTFFVISFGLIVTITVDCFMQTISHKKCYYISEKRMQPTNVRVLRVDTWKVVALIVFSLVITYFYYYEVLRIAAVSAKQLGSTGDYNVMHIYRMATAHSDTLSSQQQMNPIIEQSAKIIMVSAYICLFIWINNVLVWKDGFKRNFKYLIPVIFYLLQSLLSGGRVQLIYFVAACLVIEYILWQRKTNWRANLSGRFVKIGACFLISFLALFYSIRYVVGRTVEDIPFFTYISIYAGAPLQLLNLYLESPPMPSTSWGEECFVGLYQLLYKLGVVTNYHSIQTEFRISNGENLGNVYTFFRRPIQDFGIGGMFFFILFFVGIYTYIYHFKIKYSINSYRSDRILLLYSMFFYPIVLFSIDNCSYSLFTIGNLLTIIITLFMFWFFLKVKIVYKKGRYPVCQNGRS